MEDSNIIYLIQNAEEIVVDVDNKTYKEVTKDQSSLDAYTTKVFETVQEAGLENGVSEELSGEKFRWNNKSIKLLLEVRLGKEAQFNKPCCKKKKMWQIVANEINKIAKLNVTSELCDIKYRNLLATYRANKKKQKSSGESSITWEYFDIFDAVLGHKASSMPLSTNLGDSFEDAEDDEVDNDDNVREENASNDSHETVQSSSSCEVKNTSQRKRKSEMSLQTYLQQKLQKQEKREEEKKAHEENKLKFEKQKWEEKKILKEKEIEALLALTRALAESK